MFIRFGNLTVRQFMARVKATFDEQDIATLEALRCNKSNVPEGSFHIFDEPLSIYAGDNHTALFITEMLRKYEDEFDASFTVEGPLQ